MTSTDAGDASRDKKFQAQSPTQCFGSDDTTELLLPSSGSEYLGSRPADNKRNAEFSVAPASNLRVRGCKLTGSVSRKKASFEDNYSMPEIFGPA